MRTFAIPFLILFNCISLLSAEPAVKDSLSTQALIENLKSGGHVIYFRHASTDHNSKDTDTGNLSNCQKQRNLSAKGRIEAKSIGHAIRSHRIPIGEVISSPYCRCKDTANLAFNKFTINPDMQFSIKKDKAESKELGNKLLKLMQQADTQNTNAVFVGHTSNLREGLGIWPKPEGVAVIFKKDETELIYLGMIKPNDWPVNETFK